MNIKELKALIADMPDDMPVYINRTTDDFPLLKAEFRLIYADAELGEDDYYWAARGDKVLTRAERRRFVKVLVGGY